MGGSGADHEINWGDVSDIVREGLEKAVDDCVRECMEKSKLVYAEAGNDFKTADGYEEIREAAERLATLVANALRSAHREGAISSESLGAIPRIRARG